MRGQGTDRVPTAFVSVGAAMWPAALPPFGQTPTVNVAEVARWTKARVEVTFPRAYLLAPSRSFCHTAVLCLLDPHAIATTTSEQGTTTTTNLFSFPRVFFFRSDCLALLTLTVFTSNRSTRGPRILRLRRCCLRQRAAWQTAMPPPRG